MIKKEYDYNSTNQFDSLLLAIPVFKKYTTSNWPIAFEHDVMVVNLESEPTQEDVDYLCANTGFTPGSEWSDEYEDEEEQEPNPDWYLQWSMY